MAQTGGQTNILYTVSGYYNDVNDDPTTFPAQGQLGKWSTINFADAAKRTNKLVSPWSSTVYLQAGVYQYVNFLSTSTNSAVAGNPAFWLASSLTSGNYVVTADPGSSAVNEGLIAGVFLNTPTKGNNTIIQVAGIAWALFRDAVTANTGGVNVLQLTTTQTFDALANATGSYIGGGTVGLQNWVGQAVDVPDDVTGGDFSRITLDRTRRMY